MEFFTTGASVESWVKAGGAISPHNDSGLDWYSNEIDRRVAESILQASTVRFDACSVRLVAIDLHLGRLVPLLDCHDCPLCG